MIQGTSQVMSNLIRMKRQLFKGAFVIVEGRDDKLCLEHFLSTNGVDIIVADGKEKVIEIINILENDNFKGALGVVDADFDRIEDSQPISGNVAMPDGHDLIMMRLMTSALDSIIVEYGSRKKILELKCAVLSLLIQAALSIGYLRLHSHRSNLNLKFSTISFPRFIDRDTMSLDEERLIQEVRNKSQQYDVDFMELVESMRSIERERLPEEELCSGEDLIEILSIGLRKVLGTQNPSDVTPDLLKSALRLAMPSTSFLKTQFANSLMEWQDRNQPYCLF